MVSVVTFTIAVIGFTAVIAIDYSKTDEWGGLCKTGKKQSPVDIVEKDAQDKKLQLNLNDYEGKTYCASVNNIGFTAELKFSKEDNNDVLPTIDGDGLEGKYRLMLIHFRWGSGHTLNGRKFPFEAQIIHIKDEYKDNTEAQDKPHGLAVLSTLFKFSENSDDAPPIFDKILDSVPKEPKNGGKLCGIKLSDFLPENPKDFYRYEGSVPMPTCDETITWTVFKEYGRISKTQHKKFRELKDENGEPIKKNSRPVQPLNGRVITHSSE